MIHLFFAGVGIRMMTFFGNGKRVEVYKTKKFLNWAKFTVNILGLRVTYEGQDNIPDETCVFIGNHQSILDIPVLICGANRRIGFIAKKELLKVPILGFWFKIVHCVPIDRENVREAIKAINEGVENLKNGHSMAIFPEGTRSKDGNINEFKKGSLKLATKANVPVIPVTIDGAFRAYEEKKKFKSADIKVMFGKPIYPQNLSKEEIKDLSKIVHDEIANNLNKL